VGQLATQAAGNLDSGNLDPGNLDPGNLDSGNLDPGSQTGENTPGTIAPAAIAPAAIAPAAITPTVNIAPNSSLGQDNAAIAPNITIQTIQDSYNSLWYQINRLEEWDIDGYFAGKNIERQKFRSDLERLKHTLHDIDPLIDTLQLNQTDQYSAIIALLYQRNPDVEDMEVVFRQIYLEQDRKDQLNQRRLLYALTLLTLVVILLLIAYTVLLKTLLRQANKIAEEKSSFIHHVSHEIRTPMNSMVGGSGLLLETHLDRYQQDLARMIQSSGGTLLTIINDILNLSKLESQKLELEAKSLNIQTCMETVMEVLANELGSKAIELTYLIDSEVPSELLG